MPDAAREDVDALERSLASRIDLTNELVALGVRSQAVAHVQHSLEAYEAMRPEADRLAAADRPAQKERLEAIIEDVAAAIETMQETERTLAQLTADDRAAAWNAQQERQEVTRGIVEDSADAHAERTERGRGLL